MDDVDTEVLIPSNRTTVVEPLSIDQQIRLPEENGCISCDQETKLFCKVYSIFSVLLILLIAGLCYVADPQQYSYSLEKSDDYQDMLRTTDYGIEFYVLSSDDFNDRYPLGTFARDSIENKIIGDYKHLIQKHCGDELKHRIRFPDFPTPFCDELDGMSKHSLRNTTTT